MSARKKAGGSSKVLTSAEIRRSFLDFFADRGHTIVPSMSLVPGGDETLLFTNSGMVQFKDVFLGTGTRPYSRVVDSQKCMRVAGKHNDLDDVGRDDSHHTFFEMLGNWSFGDYYKKEAISWAWELLTEIWRLPKDNLYATCFEDELGEIPRDDEAADTWRQQPGFNPAHVLFFGRDENFWEMADTGPCGPDSEIHLDRGPEHCERQDVPGHVCRVNGDCQRYLEIWNLVFIQYNRLDVNRLSPLPKTHVDTGMGFERVVSVLQGVDSNYKTDLFTPVIEAIQRLAAHDDEEREAHWTPYRVVADHVRAATFLIGDGVVPGNVGRNYVTRMIIRRAGLFGGKIGFDEPFMAPISEKVIEVYGEAYPEIVRNREAVLNTITDEEWRFQRTVDTGIAHLEALIQETRTVGGTVLPGEKVFDHYATYGLPLEITRDIAREHGLDTDEVGFYEAMERHRKRSQAVATVEEGGAPFGPGEAAAFYQGLLDELRASGKLGPQGVTYDPYGGIKREGLVLALIVDGRSVEAASPGERVAVVIPATSYYIEAGGQVSDSGRIASLDEPRWEVAVEEASEEVSGLIIHRGQVLEGTPRVGDRTIAVVDETRRWDVMRNHTATHLLHAALREVLGPHARQAGSLVAPDRLRFDFTHPRAMTPEEIDRVEAMVNEAILSNYRLVVRHQPREEAIAEGAMALFGETYGQTVRTVSIGDSRRISFELCGGTHVPETGVIGPFLIVSEGSVAAGVRRIEAVTGRGALALIRERLRLLGRLSASLGTSPHEVESRVESLQAERDELERQAADLRMKLAIEHFRRLGSIAVDDVPILAGIVPEVGAETLRSLIDLHRAQRPSGVIVLGSVWEGRPLIVASVSQDLVARGLHAGELVKSIAAQVGGGGGGKPTMAQAGGVDADRLPEALALVPDWISSHLGAEAAP